MQISLEQRDMSLDGTDELREIFRDHTLTGIFQTATWQYHRYCINCKLSGSVYAASEIEGAVPIIHGPAGCAFHQRLTPMRLYAPVYNLPCTNLDENDVIYGGERKLREKVLEVYRRYNPSLILLLPTCISGLIGDDISGLSRDLQAQLPCSIISVASEGFAHRSRESLDGLMQESAKSWKTSRPPDYEIRGCGQEEVMVSLVDQLMEEQDVMDKQVNLESFGRFRYGSQVDLREIKRIFNDIGIGVNTTLLNCTVDDIKRAPAAELNIITRNRKAGKLMNQKFGTGYFRKWASHYGLDGIEKFFVEVGSKLGLEGEAEEVIQQEKRKAVEELERYRKTFSKFEFAVSTQGFFFTPYFASIYARDLQLPLKYFCVNTQLLKSMNTSEKTIKTMIESMQDVFDDWDFGFQTIVNPSLDEMAEMAKGVDYLLSDRITPLIYGNRMMDVSAVSHLLFRTSFSGIVEFSRYLARNLHNGMAEPSGDLILSKFQYDQLNYPIIEDPRCSASRGMWSEMWSLGSTGGD
jgi:nitrogenase molybdenum-cofactor synthesis protein NifE